MTLKDRYGFGGFSGTHPSEPNLSTPPPPPPWGFMTGPRSRRRRWPFFFFFFFFACQLSIPNQTGYIRGVQYCNRVCIWMFLVRYIMTGCIFRAPSAIWQGQVLTPPPAAPPYPVEKSSAPPPGLRGCITPMWYFTYPTNPIILYSAN